MAAIFLTTFSNAFSWMKTYEFKFRFHWKLFLWVQLTIFQHWFRQWLGADQATSHYLNQWWLDYRRIYASLGLNELTHYTLWRHMASENWAIIGWDNDLSPIRCQVIILKQGWLVVNWTLRNKYCWDSMQDRYVSDRKIHTNISSFCLRLKVRKGECIIRVIQQHFQNWYECINIWNLIGLLVTCPGMWSV